jgi:predicted short-subunit dehydrogenase-like oxidoreductase (DUF2520 family)
MRSICFAHDRYPSGLERTVTPLLIPPRPWRIALVGAGRVGTAVTELLRRRGHRVVGVSSRTSASAQAAARLLGARALADDGDLADADLVLIGTADDAVQPTAARVAPHLARGALVCHFAGSLGVAPLEAVTESGARAAALHPVQACPDVGTAIRRLPGSAWGVTCLPAAEAWAADLIAADLAGTSVPVAEGDRAAWHAAAVLTSNGLAALLSVGESILASIGIDAPERVLAPLAVGTSRNAAEGGGGGATITGPVVRGETATLERHLEALASHAPELAPLYALVGRLVVAAARRAERLDAETERSVRRVLERA